MIYLLINIKIRQRLRNNERKVCLVQTYFVTLQRELSLKFKVYERKKSNDW